MPPTEQQGLQRPAAAQIGTNATAPTRVSYKNDCILALGSDDPNAPTTADCYIPGYRASLDQDWQLELYDWDDPGDAITCGQTTVSSAVQGVSATVVAVSGTPTTLPCPNPPATFATHTEIDASSKDGVQNATVTFTVNTAVTDPTDNVTNYQEQVQFVMNVHIGQCAPDTATSPPAASTSAMGGPHRTPRVKPRRPMVGVHTEIADIFVNPVITDAAPTCDLEPTENATLVTKQFPENAPKYAYEDPNAGSGEATASTARQPQAVRRTEQANVVIECFQPGWKVDVSADGIVHVTAHPKCPPPAIVRKTTLTVSRSQFNSQDAVFGVPELYPDDCNAESCKVDLQFAADRSILTTLKPHIDYQLGNRVYPTTSKQDDESSFVVPFNALGAAYPQFHDTRFPAQEVKALVQFPQTPPLIQRCPPNGRRRAQAGCHERNDQGDFRVQLTKEYIARNWDRAILSERNREAHHVQELQWGGDNDVSYNGVFLRDYVHDIFSEWWRNLY